MTRTVLVTGGTGFVGIHTILQLLQRGYKVKTTLRSLAKKDLIINALKEAGITSFDNLSFYEAELTDDKGWDEAVKDCDYVLHIASPVPAKQPKDENEVIIPARDGALRVLRAAKRAGVKRVVLTSSFAAIGYSRNSKNHVFTEEDWTDENAPIEPYIKSKVVAEKAAWDFIKNEGGDLEFTVINPVGITGPVIGGIYPVVQDLLKSIIDGVVTETPLFTFATVDVRDVADIHIKAMLDPDADGQRFLATTAGSVAFNDIAELIKKERPEISSKIADLKPVSEEFYVAISYKKAEEILDWHPRSKEETLLASIDSIIN
ncbi:SDR family oxidoreductase [Halpernia frigidisoli]|uniref:Nucleoside-diphosphate-sugar epimerase n=1 Tax=Halpernia frigidisoli TaxID=1125876 RepID=A0A1I3F1T4_9FLAO|nr:aldehyde reductase [Halpernia frigidisoli]SFI05138.1 Nucleoside-diphosphate-sugar epimerase [Halpernia frigidisoli]